MSLFKSYIYIVHNLNIVSYLDCIVQLQFFSSDIDAHRKTAKRRDKNLKHPLVKGRKHTKIVFELIFEKLTLGIINLNYHRNKLSFNLNFSLDLVARAHITRPLMSIAHSCGRNATYEMRVARLRGVKIFMIGRRLPWHLDCACKLMIEMWRDNDGEKSTLIRL